MRRLAFDCLGIALAVASTGASTMPPPPPPPEVQSEIDRQCRTPPAETIELEQTVAPIPQSPKEFPVRWAIRLDPPPGAHLGRVVGLANDWGGSRLVAATDKGYWIDIPYPGNPNLPPVGKPVAVSIRELPAHPDHMGLADYERGSVWLSMPAARAITRYRILACFPGARPERIYDLYDDEKVLRIDPDAAGDGADIIVQRGGGPIWREEVPRGKSVVPPSHLTSEERILGSYAVAPVAGRIALARGCDELSLTSVARGTEISTSCSPSYLRQIDKIKRDPQKRHRQPMAIRHDREVGIIHAHIAAITAAEGDGDIPFTVPIGDRINPGAACKVFMAAQDAPDTPIYIYAARPYCAYYPKDRHGAPDPPPPPP